MEHCMSDIKNVSQTKDLNVPTADLHHTDTELSDIEDDASSSLESFNESDNGDDTSSGLESFDEDDMYGSDNGDDIICNGTDTDEEAEAEEAEALDRSLDMLERHMAESQSLYTNFENISTLARALYNIQNRKYASVHHSRNDQGSGAFSGLHESGILEVEGRRSDGEIGFALPGFCRTPASPHYMGDPIYIVEGIEEVVIKHTKTRCGTIQTTEKVVPVVRPQKEKSGQPSRSHKKNTQPQAQAENAKVSGRSIPTRGDLQIGPYMDEQQYSLNDTEEQAKEYGQPQPGSHATRHAHRWKAVEDLTTHYTPVTLHSLGYALCIGHGGAPCPQTVEGIRAAQATSTIRKGHAGHWQSHAHSASLTSVSEVLESLDNAGQLPTPRETPQPEGLSINPDISDRLFDPIDMSLWSNDSDSSRVRTADSGNPLFTVVDRHGIFDMEIVFCVCSGLDNTGEQLLRAGLFPSTFKQIETLFTFSVLEDFITDNLECKTTAQQYYSKLQSMTSKMFPNNVQNRYKQLLRASRQWHDLRSRMESGLGHQPEGERSPDGAMAIFCPACPQPGINLPKDWKTLYPPNFSAEHMRHRSGERDVALSAGMAFMANPDSYKAHLQSGQEIAQANSSRAHLDVTGIGATACCHGFFVPTSVVDFQKGERQINMDYSMCKALSYNMEDIPVALIMYDIMCQYRVHFQERVKNSPELSLPSSLELRMGIGLFHIHGHQDSCLPRFSPSYIPGAKQVDGEIIETLLRGMSLDHRQEVLDAHINHSNWKKLVRIVPSLLKRWKRLESGLDASAEAYQALNRHFKHKSKQWLKDEEASQRDRQISPSSMDIYDTVKEKGVWHSPDIIYP
ncbi:hypothetical protein EDB86DRAFT_2833344 [Lactarius hatsudake]|nr:hypothetical protein EDB86DRAFT_2833344 [Lactarius hatsudake]